MIKKIVLSVLLGLLMLVMLVLSPVLGSVLYHEYVRHRFEKGLYDAVVKVTGGKFHIIVRGSRVSTFGNADSCGFTAVIVFESFTNVDVVERLLKEKIRPAKPAIYGKVEIYAHRSGFMYTVIAENGGYEPWLDYRCY